MEPFIEKIYHITIDRFLFNASRMDQFSLQENGVDILQQSSFFDSNAEIFINMHLSLSQVKERLPNLPQDKKKTPFHKHDFYEMIYVYQGKVTNYIDSCQTVKELNLKQGDLCLLTPNAAHQLQVEGDCNIIFNILVKKTLFQRLAQEILSHDNPFNHFLINSLFEKNQEESYLLFSKQLCSTIDQSVLQLIKEYAETGNQYFLKLNGYLMILFSDLLTAYQNYLDENSIQQVCHPKISEILSYIIENCSTVTLEKTAEQFHYNPQYLSRLLKQYTNQSFSSFRRQIRMERAIYLLTHTDRPIQDIIDRSGFETAYFFRVFHEKYHISPLEYRKRFTVL